MAADMTTLVWERSHADGTALLVLLRLAHWADRADSDTCWASVEAIAQRLNRKGRMIRYALHWLRDHGEIAIDAGSGPGGTNHYRITLAGKAMFPVERHAIDCMPPVQSIAEGQATDCTPGMQPAAEGAATDCMTDRQTIAGGPANHCLQGKEKKEKPERESARARGEGSLSGEFFVIEEEPPEPVESARAAFEALGGRCTSFPQDWPTQFLGLTGGQVRAICATIPGGVLPTLPSRFGVFRTAWEVQRGADAAQRKLVEEAERRAVEQAARSDAEQGTASAMLAEIDARPDFVAGLGAVRKLEYIEASGKVRHGRADSLAIHYLRRLLDAMKSRPALRLVGAL